MKKQYEFVVDIETLPNCFILCGEDAASDKKFHFVLWKNRNEFAKLYTFLDYCIKNGSVHVTFNGLAFDSQVLQYIIDRRDFFMDELFTVDQKIDEIYKKAQECIQRGFNNEWNEYPEWELQIPQIDIFMQNHWSSPAKLCSLKWLQCAMDWPNVEDMPYHHTHYVENETQLNEIIAYCYNDVAATKKAYHLCAEGTKVRKELSSTYRLNLNSASEPKLAKELFLHFLSEKLMKDKRELKRWATQRDIIKVNDIILPYVKFERQEFTMLLNNFKKLEIKGELRNAFKYKVKYKGMTIDYGVGGVHGFANEAVYQSDDENIIIDSDVSSYYPNLAIKNKWAPAHIPKQAFCDQYEWFYEERKKYAKGTAINYVYKILLNSSYGLSIDKHSFLSDPQLGVSIVINGQLLLSMLLEMLCEEIPNSKPLVQNTDGLTMMIPRKYETLYKDICTRWEKQTGLVLEHDTFAKLCSFDSNNFIGKYTNGKAKCKGRFEFEPHDKYEVNVLHKNKSFLVVPKAIYEYFINGVQPEEYLERNNNIFDYCGYFRARGDWKTIEYSSSSEGIKQKQIQKTLRYYVSETGNKVIKRNEKDLREIKIVAGNWLLQIFNKYEEKPWQDYKIDKRFYLKEIQKEINTLEKKTNQLQLF